MGAQPDNLIASGAGAVLFLPVDDRIFAICFGHIHMALEDEAFERQFGLKVTLNLVPRDGLCTLDLAIPDAVTFQKRVQASKDSDVQDFGVDVLRDLARIAGGTPREASFAKFVAGRDSLSIACSWRLMICWANASRSCWSIAANLQAALSLDQQYAGRSG